MSAPMGLTCPSCGHALYQRGRYVQGVTRAQGDVLNFYARAAIIRQPTPSYSEIATALGYKSKSQVSDRVHALVAKGFLALADDGNKRRYRNVIVTDKAWALYRDTEHA